MTWAVTLLLVAAMIGLPLGVAHTEVTIVLAGWAGLFSVMGVLIRNSPLLTTGVAVSLVEALLAFRQGGEAPHLLLAMLLGVVIYMLLDISAFYTTFHDVSVDTSVWRMEAMHWGWVSLLLGLVGLMLGLIATILVRPFTNPLLGQVLPILTAVIAVGAVLMLIRVWRQQANYFFNQP
jgi:hypothetical protein